MNHLQTDTLIAAWRDDAETARKAGHEQNAREIEAAAGLFERQAAEIKALRENNAALQAECDEMNAELHDMRVASQEKQAPNILTDQCYVVGSGEDDAEEMAADLHLQQAIKERDALAAWLDECLSAMRYASEFLDESDKGAALALRRMDILSSRSRRLADSLAHRDARMKAEVLENVAGDSFAFDSDELRAIAAEYREQAEGASDGKL